MSLNSFTQTEQQSVLETKAEQRTMVDRPKTSLDPQKLYCWQSQGGFFVVLDVVYGSIIVLFVR